MKIRLIKIGLFFVAAFGFFTLSSLANKVAAQSFSMSPNSGSITVSGTQAVQITAVNPPGSSNSAQIRISVPGSLVNVTNFSPPGGSYILLPGSGCSGTYTATQVCFDIAKTGGAFLTNGELLGTFTLTGVSDGIANINFGSGNRYTGQSDFTGTGASFTIGAGGGDPVDGEPVSNALDGLPNTGVVDEKLLLIMGIGFISLGIGFYVVNSDKFMNYFEKNIDRRFEEKLSE